MNAVYPTAADLVVFDIHANLKKTISLLFYITSSYNTKFYVRYT